VAKRVILITGASSGIGLATARALAGPEASLFLVGRRLDRLEGLARELTATPLVADLSDPETVQRLATDLARQTDRLDVLINCAGELAVGPAERLGPTVAERLMRVNCLGPIAMIHSCLPLLRRAYEPVIVNVSSMAGRLAPPYMAAYAASKFALNGYTQALRQELRAEGIHVGLVMPGPVDTPMVHGRLGGRYYAMPPGVPLLTSGQAADAILRVVARRLPELVLPRRLGAALRLGAAYPSLVDLLYRNQSGRSERDWA
jgi:short-subunit dehydrogenase